MYTNIYSNITINQDNTRENLLHTKKKVGIKPPPTYTIANTKIKYSLCVHSINCNTIKKIKGFSFLLQINGNIFAGNDQQQDCYFNIFSFLKFKSDCGSLPQLNTNENFLWKWETFLVYLWVLLLWISVIYWNVPHSMADVLVSRCRNFR